MNDLNAGDLTIKVEEKNTDVYISWLGKSREREPGAVINPYIEGIISDLEGKKLIMDFVKLEYMNSSTVPSIIKMFKLLDTRKIQTKVLYNKSSNWQSASFKALSTIAQSLKCITVDGITNT